jgi:hypothetical protein
MQGRGGTLSGSCSTEVLVLREMLLLLAAIASAGAATLEIGFAELPGDEPWCG